MTDEGDDTDHLINDAIDESIKFEKLMDETDFDSWLDGDSPETLKNMGQLVYPFNIYKDNKNKLKKICKRKRKGPNKIPNASKSQVEKYITYQLFLSKNKRLDARISSEKDEEENKYEEALYYLLSVLNHLHNSKIDEKWLKKWLILLYNDLSICYAGLGNSSMSRGYAKEARKIIEGESSYTDFETEIAEKGSIESHNDFISSKLYYLYTIALYNQAEAERRSYQKNESERNFKKIISYEKIISYGEKDTKLIDFNYYSAIVNLSDLYMDQGRSEEALELLEKVINEENAVEENDIRYWKASLRKIHALIDQSEYKKAKDELSKKFIKDEKDSFSLNKRNKVTNAGFKALMYYVSRYIELAKNNKQISGQISNEDKNNLDLSIKILENKFFIDILQKRKQEGPEKAVYKHLSEINKLVDNDKKAKKYIIKFLSMEEISLLVFAKDENMKNWIKKCEDLTALENFADLILKELRQNDNKKVEPLQEVLRQIRDKIKKESEDRDELFRGKIVKKINEQVKEKKRVNDWVFENERIYNLMSILLFCTKEDYLKCTKEDYLKNYIKKIKSEDLVDICKDFGLEVCKDNNNIIDGIIKFLKDHKNGHLDKEDIRKRLDITEIEFDSILFNKSEMEEKHLVEVIVLRRWNSFSPGLYRESTGSLGGGYLLRINKTLLKKGEEEEDREDKKKDVEIENIVIDPGYNFLQNFRREGFHVVGIDTIIVTHSHLDHCADLLPIMDLIYQINKRNVKLLDEDPKKRKSLKKVNLCLSQGAYKKFSSYIDDPNWTEQLKDVILIENLREMKWEVFSNLTISAIKTEHIDLGGVNSIGLKIEIGIPKEEKKERKVENVEKSKIVLGFTSDTPWYPNIRGDFEDCDLLCVHLGSIKYQEIGYNDNWYNSCDGDRKFDKKTNEFEEFKKTYIKSNHLLFYGTEDIISYYNKNKTEKDPLIIIGEFGEELKYGLRVDLCKKLSMGKSIDCLPGDIGQYTVIEKDGTKKVRCDFCEHFVKPKEIKTFSYGREDALHYICQTCDNTLSDLQKQAFIEHRVTRH